MCHLLMNDSGSETEGTIPVCKKESVLFRTIPKRNKSSESVRNIMIPKRNKSPELVQNVTILKRNESSESVRNALTSKRTDSSESVWNVPTNLWKKNNVFRRFILQDRLWQLRFYSLLSLNNDIFLYRKSQEILIAQ